MDSYFALYAFAGLAVGTLVGFTGVGGGALMTPLLVLLFGMHPVSAVGTDLLFAAFTKAVGTAVHGAKKTVNWSIVKYLASGSIPAAIVTLWALSYIDRDDLSFKSSINMLLGLLLVVTALVLFFREHIFDAIKARAGGYHQLTENRRTLLTIGLGLSLGFVVTLSSVGAGALGVTILVLLYPSLPMKDVVGSDISHAVPLTLVAGAGYFLIGEVEWTTLLYLLCGSVPGVVIGSLLAPYVPERILRIVLAVTLTLVGIKMVFV